MTYTPHRDERFEYIEDVIHFVENNQCHVCRFRKSMNEWGAGHALEFPMCSEVEGPLMLEQPVAELNDKGAAGIVCSKFKLGKPPAEPDDPHQMELPL